MTVGLPGTGIGGLFYLLLVFWMPCRELYLLARGRSSVQRWKSIAFFLSITMAIIATTWAMAWGLSQIINTIAGYLNVVPVGQSQGYRVLAGVSIAMSLGSLVVVLLAIQGLRLVMRWKKARLRQTVRTFPDLFPEGGLNSGKGFQGRLDQSGPTA